MTKLTNNEEIVWTPQMPDRRKCNRRVKVRGLHPNGKALNIGGSLHSKDRRAGGDRRHKVSLTITGRAMDLHK